VANLPRTEPVTRKDPAPRPISGVPTRGIELENKADGRKYVLVDKGAGGNREVICPAYYQELGWTIEYWPAFAGLKDKELEAAKRASLRFRGQDMGRAGEPMETRGHVLMSIDAAVLAEHYAAAQAEADPIEDAIMNPEKSKAAQLERARAALRDRHVDPTRINASLWDGSAES
jgi:hypothetical protein